MYDLHTHTYYSDGTDSPRELILRAKAAGLGLVAVTDHDTTAGLDEAASAAREVGLPLICGAEIEALYAPAKLHILGLGINAREERFAEMLEIQDERRKVRNEAMLEKLASSGMDIRPYYQIGRGCTTRTHIAKALVGAGYAESTADAFSRLIGRGMPYFVDCEHPSMRETVERIINAGGRAVLAHPHKMRCDHEALIRELADYGLWGVEVYYPGSGAENEEYFKNLAQRYGLAVTCGSDHHGANRPSVTPGCSWRDVPELKKTYEIIRKLAI